MNDETVTCQACGRLTNAKSIFCEHCQKPSGCAPFAEKHQKARATKERPIYKKCVRHHKNEPGELWCQECNERVPDTRYTECERCGREIPAESELCSDCLEKETLSQQEPNKQDGGDKLSEPRIISQRDPTIQTVVRPGSVIGREGDINTTALGNNYISRKHATFVFENGKWFIRNLNPVNGTSVNMRKLMPEETVELHNDTRIALHTEIFVFRWS